MKNPVVGTAHFGPVYKRKIHVYFKKRDGLWYAWSTNAHRTCCEAVAAAKRERPEWDFVANFAKD
jgi:hypothetical protein